MTPASPSLKRRLIRQLVLLQVAIQLLVIGTLAASGYLIDFSSPENTVEILQEAVAHDATGKLIVRSTQRLVTLRETVPHLWFSIRDHQGGQVVEGRIPSEFARIGDTLDAVRQARLGWNIGDPPRQAARMRWVDSAAGDVQILTGPDSPVTWRNLGLALLLLLAQLVLPIMAITITATLLATHFVVKRTLAGLNAAAARAGQIDIDQRGVRLPLTDVPNEVATLVGAFNDALQRLDDGYARHERFLADAAHELRTPLAILNTRLENLPDSPDKVRLLSDAARLSVLAGQLLDLQRMKGSGSRLQRVDLLELARDVVAEMAPLALAAGYEISFEPATEGVEAEGDRDALARALTNLVQNAIDHAGGQGSVVVRVNAAGNIDVIDDGPGIPSALRAQVFKPFYRVHATGPGAGLGLSLVQEIVQMHQGDISVHDAPNGGGTQFRMHLPPVPADRLPSLSLR
ncbi:HAMP domain-containing histidine kinase [Variovorax sp. ZS18.2.2]|uniref:sensor histidine kinase n=1 Tax=Variovorax sp. ZS18.2.2 TaxID=2971255 RepID=UPI002150C3D6|nr:HAMP domain-containing sensor histidine kinase [Variovorax sp. ZS18.2.2]MCR6480409.1 HAMP domain-containing histidine kinase [Variovorax sp. ZS18.2.2]